MTTKFVQYGKLRYRISKSKDGRSRLEIVKRGIIDITEIIGLNQLHDLDELDLSKNKISDITGLENLTNLKVLDLSYNAIADPQTMKKLKENHLNLKDIYLRGNPCFDSMEDIYACLNPKYKGSGIACEPCQSLEDDPINGSECYESAD